MLNTFSWASPKHDRTGLIGAERKTESLSKRNGFARRNERMVCMS